MAGRFGSLIVAILVAATASPARGDVTAEEVNAAIGNGIAYLEKQQHPGGNWTDYPTEAGGVTALCTLALLNCGRTAADPSVKKALDYLERMPPPDRIYSVSLSLMAFAQADPQKYAAQIRQRAMWIESKQTRGDMPYKGGWRYYGTERISDNSSTQFAILALHEAERAGIKVADQTWQLAANYWTQKGMQNPDGSFRYDYEDAANKGTGSMTCAGIACLIILRDRLQPGDATVVNDMLQCCGNQVADDSVERALAWMGQHFSVRLNPGDPRWVLYYLYGLERVGRMSGQRYFFTQRNAGNGVTVEQHDWYREGCEYLLQHQDPLLKSWIGIGGAGSGEGDNPSVSTSFALLFLSKGRRPVVIAKLKYQPDNAARPLEWDHHRRAIQNLTMRVEKEEAWKRDLSWQTIDFVPRGGGGAGVPRLLVSAADLLEAPVLFLSGSAALDFDANQKTALKNYVENGGFLLAEACDGNGCNGKEFDRSFRTLMQEIFPDSALRRLPPDHGVWYAQEKVDPKHLPKDQEFWLWGLDACCRTSVVYCPRSLSCYWELAHPYRETKLAEGLKNEVEAVTRIGMNVLAYATGRELKDKLDKPQLAIGNPGGKTPRGALAIPKLSHGGGADDAPLALNNLMTVMQKQFQRPVDFQRRLLPANDPRLLDYPIVFMHGRRAFQFGGLERQGLKTYLDRGGFLFADAICANKEFAAALKSELKAIYPIAQFTRLPLSHPIFSAEKFNGFDLHSVTLRDPQIRAEGDPLSAKLVKTEPSLEGLEIDGRIAVVLSPYDISCALERGVSLECKGYIPADAARLAANVILFGLGQ
jgi:hypothetical protein